MNLEHLSQTPKGKGTGDFMENLDLLSISFLIEFSTLEIFNKLLVSPTKGHAKN